jgi:succinate-semialdehyde dehydrogenase / glutarate-semialdehyde dehydrogenase
MTFEHIPGAPIVGHESDVFLFINGAWLPGAAGALDNIDPGNGERIGRVGLADPHQVQLALEAAARAFPAWSRTHGRARGAVLKRSAELLQERMEHLVDVLIREGGKTRADAQGEALRTIETLAWNGEEAPRIGGRTYPGVVDGSVRLSTPTPLGVAVAITAWNFPAVLIARKLGAALAAGCTVVLKASEFTPLSARLILQALVDAGLPPGVVNLVFGDPVQISEQLLASSVVKVLSFTGSTSVGKQLAGLAARHLIRPVLELGGHAPVIVCSDADIDRVVAVTAPAKFGTAGQSCVAPTRYLVHESLHDRLVSALVDRARSFTLGHGSDPQTTLGPVAHAGRLQALGHLVADAVGKGARLEVGGQPLAGPGCFFMPTVLSQVSADAQILAEEPFGPVATVQSFHDLDQAIEMANATPYAFAAYLFTDSMRVRNEVVMRLQASNIGVNQTAPSLPDVPLGGLGSSGYGYEGGTDGVLAYMQLRLVSQSA